MLFRQSNPASKNQKKSRDCESAHTQNKITHALMPIPFENKVKTRLYRKVN